MLFKDNSTRIFFASDIHGSETCFRKFLNSAKFYDAKALIFGGDITGKAIIPIVKNNGGYISNLYGNEVKINGENELNEFIKLQKNKGFYPYVTDKEEYEELKNNKEKLNEKFKELINERIRQWVVLANERLRDTKVKVYWEAGNDDFLDLDSLMESENTIYIGEKVVDLFDLKIAGLSYANTTPWNAPRDVPEEKLIEIINSMLKSAGFGESEKTQEIIFAFHPPPFDTILDLAPKVRADFTYARVGGQRDFIHVGSIAVRKAIESYKPLLSLHGHIHESKGVDKVGNTLSINPGSEYSEGILHGALINLDKGKVKSYILTTG
jgi:Predicted phosphoesterases, related to the Icc protein